jgi:cysteine-rich repeat protein
MVQTDACLNNCQAAKCGDGQVQAGVEQCDDGNMVDNDACSNTCKLSLGLRPNVLLCGTSQRDIKTFFPGGVNQFVVMNSCVPDANTQAMIVTRSANQALIVQATLQAYLNAGGIVLTEYSITDDVFSKAFAAVAQGGGNGSCQDTAPTQTQYTPGDPFWVANGFTAIAANQTGCGFSVQAFPGITPLAGWGAGTVAVAYRQSMLGRFWLTDFDWQDNEAVQPMAYTLKLMGYMITHRN